MGTDTKRLRSLHTKSATIAVGKATRIPTKIMSPRSILNAAATYRGPGVGGTKVWVMAAPAHMAMR